MRAAPSQTAIRRVLETLLKANLTVRFPHIPITLDRLTTAQAVLDESHSLFDAE